MPLAEEPQDDLGDEQRNQNTGEAQKSERGPAASSTCKPTHGVTIVCRKYLEILESDKQTEGIERLSFLLPE